MQRLDLEKLGILNVVVIGTYRRSLESFILMVTNGLGPKDMHVLSFFHEFYTQYNHEVCNISRPTITLIKNVVIVVYNEQ
jgi:hypothetical protein